MAALAPVALPFAREARAYQHITNGGFEAGLAGWTAGPGVSLSIASDAPAEGVASARITVGSSAARIEYALTGALAPGAYDVLVQARSASDAWITLSIAPAPQPRFEIGESSTNSVVDRDRRCIHAQRACQHNADLAYRCSAGLGGVHRRCSARWSRPGHTHAYGYAHASGSDGYKRCRDDGISWSDVGARVIDYADAHANTGRRG